MKKYQVIGGQYEQYWYGESDALRSAACDLIDPETAEDDDTLFKLHLSAVAAADRLDNTIIVK